MLFRLMINSAVSQIMHVISFNDKGFKSPAVIVPKSRADIYFIMRNKFFLRKCDILEITYINQTIRNLFLFLSQQARP